MLVSSIAKILNAANLARNGYAWESKTHRFDVLSNDKKKAFTILVSRLDGSDRDMRADYNNSVRITTLKELKSVLIMLGLADQPKDS